MNDRNSNCFLCVQEFKNPQGLKIHKARSVKHYINKLERENPEHISLDRYFFRDKKQLKKAELINNEIDN